MADNRPPDSPNDVHNPGDDRTIAQHIGGRLRVIRRQKGLSLNDVEAQSHGRWKAAILSAYERGDRSIAAFKLAELAGFYQVPVAALLPDTAAAGRGGRNSGHSCRIDVTALQNAPENIAGTLRRFVTSIQDLRGDYNGQVITLRDSDLQMLAAVHRCDVPTLLRVWRSHGLLTGETP